MSKYDALWRYIRDSGEPKLTLGFDEIGQIAGVSLDHAFLRNPCFNQSYHPAARYGIIEPPGQGNVTIAIQQIAANNHKRETSRNSQMVSPPEKHAESHLEGSPRFWL